MWNTYGLWTSKVEASSNFFTPLSTRTIFYIWKYNVNFIRFSAVNFVIFILERLIKGGNRGVRATAEFDTVCCLSLPKLIIDTGLWKRPAGKMRILLEHFRMILKWNLYWYLRWKLMLTLLAAVMWGNVVLRHIIFPARASYIRYKKE